MFLKVSNDKRSLKIKRNKILILVQSRSYPSDALDSIAPLRAHTFHLDSMSCIKHENNKNKDENQ